MKASPRAACQLIDLNARLVAEMLEPDEAATIDRIERAALTLLRVMAMVAGVTVGLVALPLAMAFATGLFWLAILAVLYRRKIFLKV